MSALSGLQGRRCSGRGYHWLALALAAPALCLGQESSPQSAPPPNPPVTSTATPGLPAAELPGAQLPGFAPLASRFMNAADLLPEFVNYTQYGASVGVGATDDVNLSATHRKSQTLAAANLFLDLIRKGSRLEVMALGDFSDINYLEHAYSNEVLGRFDGTADETLWQRHLKWLVREDYGDQQINPLQAMTPTNLERVSIFSTGPELTLTPTLTSFVKLRGVYSRSSYQSSPFDAQSGTVSAALGHNFSSASSLSLNADVEKLMFDNTAANRDYQRRAYYGRYSLHGARTAIDLQLGVNQANDLGRWQTSPLARLSITRNVSAYSTLTLAGGRQYGDAMGSFAETSGGAGGGIPIAAAAGTTANSQHTYGNASWEFHRLRTTIGVSGGWERRSFDVDTKYSATRENVGLSLGRNLTPTLSVNLLGTLNRSDYFNQGFTDEFGTAGAGVVYRPGRWLVLYGRYDHQFRRPGGAARGLGFDENRIYVMIGYYPHSSGTGTPGQGSLGLGGMM